jgi:hypothetical protein
LDETCTAAHGESAYSYQGRDCRGYPLLSGSFAAYSTLSRVQPRVTAAPARCAEGRVHGRHAPERVEAPAGRATHGGTAGVTPRCGGRCEFAVTAWAGGVIGRRPRLVVVAHQEKASNLKCVSTLPARSARGGLVTGCFPHAPVRTA